MTLTVRLDETLESALDRYCAAHRVSKSLVVQQSLAAYLVRAEAATVAARGVATPSPALAALRRAGLIGSGEIEASPADKARVRAAARQRVSRTVR